MTIMYPNVKLDFEMSNSVYKINKGINKSIEFKGLKAQYIWYMGAVVVGLLIVFSVLYFIGINQYICILIVGGTGFVAMQKIFGLSKKYGEHGLSKMMARKGVPKVVKSNDRKIFIHPNKSSWKEIK